LNTPATLKQVVASVSAILCLAPTSCQGSDDSTSARDLRQELAAERLGTPVTDWPNELSGLARLRDGSLLAIDDEERRRVFLLPAPAATTPAHAIDLPIRMDDLEAATTDEEGHLYLLTSHSLTKKGKHRRDRRLLVRFDPSWPRSSAAPAVVRDLDHLLDAAYTAFLEGEPAITFAPIDFESRRRSSATFNLEGLTWYPAGQALLLGARHPLNRGRAVVFAIEPATALFAGDRVRLRVEVLDLEGRAIRGLAHDADRDGVLVLAGPGGSEGGGYAVFLWRPNLEAGDRDRLVELEVAELQSAPQPEGILPGQPPSAGGGGTILVVTEGRLGGNPPLFELDVSPLPSPGSASEPIDRSDR
jgi:hypothetical protein